MLLLMLIFIISLFSFELVSTSMHLCFSYRFHLLVFLCLFEADFVIRSYFCQLILIKLDMILSNARNIEFLLFCYRNLYHQNRLTDGIGQSICKFPNEYFVKQKLDEFVQYQVYNQKKNRKMKKGNLIDFVESISKKIIEKVQLNKEKRNKQAQKSEQIKKSVGSHHINFNNQQRNSYNEKSVSKQQKSVQSIVNKQSVQSRKSSSKSTLDKAKENTSNTRQIKQKLIKMSNAKMSERPIINMKMVEKQTSQTKKIQRSIKLQHTRQKKENNSHYQSLSKSISTNKIRENNTQPMINSRLLAKNQQQLRKQLQFTDLQTQRLKLYFKHHCQLVKNYPKSSTFQNVKNILNSFNMTEWMIFCKNLHIIDRFRSGNKEGLRILSYLFKKYQNSEYRITYDRFQILVAEVILDIVEHQMKNINRQNMSEEEYQKNKKQRINEVVDWLCLNDTKKHKIKLKQMGVMCSQQIYYVPKYGQQSQRRDKSLNNSIIEVRLSRPSMPVLESASISTPQKHKLPKIYKNFVQRKQSKLMHSLAVTNLHQFVPTDQTKNFLQKYIGIDDRYLKQYFKKQDQVKTGVLKTLDMNTKSNEKISGKSAGKILVKSGFGKELTR